MRVRRAVPEDREALTALDQQAWTAASTPAELPLAPEGFPGGLEGVWVATDDAGVVLGYAEVGPATGLASHAGVWTLTGLAVRVETRRQGVATRLLDAVVDAATQAGAHKLVARALASNGAALALYDRVGFAIEARLQREFCIEGAWVDDLRLVRWLALDGGEPSAWVEGGCHCGQVGFEVRIRDWVCLDCDCSICTKKGFLHCIVDPENLRWRSDPAEQSVYRFHTRTAVHHFCPTCGIHAVYRPRSHPEAWDVNVRCLPAEIQRRFVVRPFAGSRWEDAIHRIRD